MNISLMPFALNSSYFSMYTGACELQEGVNAPGTPTSKSRSASALPMMVEGHAYTHKDVLASRRERDRFGGVVFLEGFLEREFISWLGLMLGKECRCLFVGGVDCTGSETLEEGRHRLRRCSYRSLIGSFVFILSRFFPRCFPRYIILRPLLDNWNDHSFGNDPRIPSIPRAGSMLPIHNDEREPPRRVAHSPASPSRSTPHPKR